MNQARPRPSPFGLVARFEWSLIRRDISWWMTLAILLGCLFYALRSGEARVAERGRLIQEAVEEESGRLASLRRMLGKIERGEVKPPDAPFRDPGNPIYVGRGQGATVAYLPDAPLSLTAVGLSDLYPAVLKVSAGSKDSFLFADEIANPSQLLAGSFDLAFLVVTLYPLMILALSYNILSAERENGTLALILASSARLSTVMLGKLTVRLGLVSLALIGGLMGFLAWRGILSANPTALGPLLIVSALILAYGLFWAGLALLVNSLGRDSASNAVTLVSAWALISVVGPAVINAVAQASYPAPARAEMILAVRGAAVDSERDQAATEARYREEHRTGEPGTGGRRINDKRSRDTLATTVAADARADEVLAAHEAQIRRQRELGNRLAFLVPPVLLNDALTELAGNGPSRMDLYLDRVGRFHESWQGFFVERARAGDPLTTADYERFPRFDAEDGASSWLPTILPSLGLTFLWLLVMGVPLYAWSIRRLDRAG